MTQTANANVNVNEDKDKNGKRKVRVEFKLCESDWVGLKLVSLMTNVSLSETVKRIVSREVRALSGYVNNKRKGGDKDGGGTVGLWSGVGGLQTLPLPNDPSRVSGTEDSGPESDDDVGCGCPVPERGYESGTGTAVLDMSQADNRGPERGLGKGKWWKLRKRSYHPLRKRV